MRTREQAGGRAAAVRWRGEAERLAAEHAAVRAQVAVLREKVATLAKLAFGASSEYLGTSLRSLMPGPESRESCARYWRTNPKQPEFGLASKLEEVVD